MWDDDYNVYVEDNNRVYSDDSNRDDVDNDDNDESDRNVDENYSIFVDIIHHPNFHSTYIIITYHYHLSLSLSKSSSLSSSIIFPFTIEAYNGCIVRIQSIIRRKLGK